MDDKTLAMLGDRDAQERITERGELLPCPKCKGEELTITGNGYNIYDPDTLGYVDSVPDTYIYIVCEDCGIVSSSVDVNDDEEYAITEKRLIAEWNTRVPLITPEQIKRLEDM
jgi:hypothetical protein